MNQNRTALTSGTTMPSALTIEKTGTRSSFCMICSFVSLPPRNLRIGNVAASQKLAESSTSAKQMIFDVIASGIVGDTAELCCADGTDCEQVC